MANPTRLEGDVHVNGALSAKTMSLPAGTVANAGIAANAGVSATKLEHQHRKHYSQPNTAATTETRSMHVVYGTTGTIVDFKAGSIGIAVGNSTVTVDLKKNGTTCLSAVITLDTANVARVAETGTLSVTTLAAGDLLEIVITATIGSGTLPTGFFATLTVHEDAQ